MLAATQADQEARELAAGVRRLAEDRGAALFADLNQDGADDVVVFPTLISDVGLGPKGARKRYTSSTASPTAAWLWRLAPKSTESRRC